MEPKPHGLSARSSKQQTFFGVSAQSSPAFFPVRATKWRRNSQTSQTTFPRTLTTFMLTRLHPVSNTHPASAHLSPNLICAHPPSKCSPITSSHLRSAHFPCNCSPSSLSSLAISPHLICAPLTFLATAHFLRSPPLQLPEEQPKHPAPKKFPTGQLPKSQADFVMQQLSTLLSNGTLSEDDIPLAKAAWNFLKEHFYPAKLGCYTFPLREPPEDQAKFVMQVLKENITCSLYILHLTYIIPCFQLFFKLFHFPNFFFQTWSLCHIKSGVQH